MNEEELEEAIETIKNSYVMSTKHCLDDENIKLKQATETVLQALEEQEKEIVKYQLYLTEDVIPKKKIKDKIKELEENGYWNFLEQRDLDKTIKILQELLEDK